MKKDTREHAPKSREAARKTRAARGAESPESEQLVSEYPADLIRSGARGEITPRATPKGPTASASSSQVHVQTSAARSTPKLHQRRVSDTLSLE